MQKTPESTLRRQREFDRMFSSVTELANSWDTIRNLSAETAATLFEKMLRTQLNVERERLQFLH